MYVSIGMGYEEAWEQSMKAVCVLNSTKMLNGGEELRERNVKDQKEIFAVRNRWRKGRE